MISFFKRITGQRAYEMTVQCAQEAHKSLQENIKFSQQIVEKIDDMIASVDEKSQQMHDMLRQCGELSAKAEALFEETSKLHAEVVEQHVAIVEQKNKKSAKEIATENKEPYVAILNVDLDPDDIEIGAFELDWNDYFVARLIKAGYSGKNDAEIVDNWFQVICNNVAGTPDTNARDELYATVRSVGREDLGNGMSGIY